MPQRRTRNLLLIGIQLMQDPFARYWGYELAKQVRLPSGVVYPLLHRLLVDGWLIDGWEEQREGGQQRPPRRYYELTDVGRIGLGALIVDAEKDTKTTKGAPPK